MADLLQENLKKLCTFLPENYERGKKSQFKAMKIFKFCKTDENENGDIFKLKKKKKVCHSYIAFLHS